MSNKQRLCVLDHLLSIKRNTNYLCRDNRMVVTGLMGLLDPPQIVEHTSDDRIVARYQRGSYLGKGASSRCYIFKNMQFDTCTPLAAKVIDKRSLTKPRHRERVQKEINIHRSLSHPHVVRYINNFEDRDNHYILMELCEGRTVLEMQRSKRRLNEDETRYLMKQLIDAMMYLHSQHIIHRDLKPGNLFLTTAGQLKVGDFGLAARIEYGGELKRTVCGTPSYIAPEVLNSRRGHSYEADIWSIGVLMFALLVGKGPFETTSIKQTYRLIQNCTYSFPDRVVCLSDPAKNLIKSILRTDPRERPSLNCILRHPFFTGEALQSYRPLSAPPSMSLPEYRATSLLSFGVARWTLVEEEARRRTEDEARKKAEEVEAAARKRADEVEAARKKAEEEARKKQRRRHARRQRKRRRRHVYCRSGIGGYVYCWQWRGGIGGGVLCGQQTRN